ncbi:MAG: GT4 family glycosyltransferase PelF [Ignavibacteriales bacterium]|nr:GT4 family glycosyltransferase PelF [Ignavibacteriales bacterium]
MTNGRLSVLLLTEGTYPYAGGGVSTWCDLLCRELSDVDFFVVAVTGTPIAALKYKIPENVQYVRQVPLWGSEEPSEYVRPDTAFADVYLNRVETTPQVIRHLFIPVFEKFLREMFSAASLKSLDPNVIHQLYRYFQQYEYKRTIQSPQVWKTFLGTIQHQCEISSVPDEERPTLFDLTTAMRWLYNYLMPLNAFVPKTDLAHATIAGVSNLPAIAAKLEYGTPIIVTDHGIYIRERYIAISAGKFTPFAKRFMVNLSSYATRLLYSTADQISPVCNYNHRWETRFDADAARIKTIYNGIDPAIFVPKEKPEKTRNRPTVVAAARIFPLKDIETMIRSCSVVREHIPDVQYIVYGPFDVDPPYTKRCVDLISELQLHENFRFAGFHSKPHELYHEGDISILSSISEGFPYTVLESMACARPVVATDVGGVREALEGFGFIVKPRDAQALGEGVIKLLQDHELRERLGTMGREQVLLRFRNSQTMNTYRKSYASLSLAAAQTVIPN